MSGGPLALTYLFLRRRIANQHRMPNACKCTEVCGCGEHSVVLGWAEMASEIAPTNRKICKCCSTVNSAWLQHRRRMCVCMVSGLLRRQGGVVG